MFSEVLLNLRIGPETHFSEKERSLYVCVWLHVLMISSQKDWEAWAIIKFVNAKFQRKKGEKKEF